MNSEDVIKENQELKELNEKLKIELEEIKQKIQEYKKTYKPTEEQKKKWAKTAYLNKKTKMEKEKQENI